MLNSDLNGGCISRLTSTLVETVRNKASGLADDVVRQSEKSNPPTVCVLDLRFDQNKFPYK